MTDEELQEMIDEADRDGDGEVRRRSASSHSREGRSSQICACDPRFSGNFETLSKFSKSFKHTSLDYYAVVFFTCCP